DPVLGQVDRVVGGRRGGGVAVEVEGLGGGLKADRLALGVRHAGLGIGPFTAVGARQEGAVHAVIGVGHLVVEHHRGSREGVHMEGRVVGDVHVPAGAGSAVHDVGVTAEGLRVAVVLVGQLLDG